MKSNRKLAAFVMCLALASQMLPATVSAEGEADSAPGYAVNNIPVTVTAIDKATGEEVPVEGASVAIYIDGKVRKQVLTNEKGEASIPTSGFTQDELYHATVSAYKTLAQERSTFPSSGAPGDDLVAGTGTERDGLFGYFPENSDGSDYYRTEYQLRSETIDDNGNWVGEGLKVRSSGKVDIVFALDATGSMTPVINNVKNNIEKFSENLTSQGLDIRFSIIEYRDIDEEDEETILHTYEGSKWFTNATAVKDVLSNIEAKGGGDTPESALDALGMVADDSMFWRSDAHRFAFLLTDADFHINNNYGYESMSDLADVLKKKGIVTSVVTDSSDSSSYTDLEKTGGKVFSNISSDSFYTNLKELSDGIVSYVVDAKKLVLQEPRVLYNVSLSYLANDKKSQSEDYTNSLKALMKEYSKDVAQTTDGHVMINKVILHPTSDRMNFFDTSDLASMADIQMQSRESDDGVLFYNVRIHSNAYRNGYYFTHTLSSDESVGSFKYLKDADSYKGTDKRVFPRIQVSGVGSSGEGTGSFIDDRTKFAATLTHETGHYMFSFFDEYMDKDGNVWDSTNRPFENYGVMDGQFDEIELSKADGAYSYFGGTFPDKNDPKHTRHSSETGGSTEDTLADLIENGMMLSGSIPYETKYTKAPDGNHRRADYSYSEVSDEDFIYVASDATAHAADASATGAETESVSASFFEDIKPTATSFGRIAAVSGEDSVTVTIDAEKADAYTLYLQKPGQKGFTKYAFDAEKKAVLPIAAADVAELRIVGEQDGKKCYNSYFIQHTDKTTKGVLYSSPDDRVSAYTENTDSTCYTFLADNTYYTNGDYTSVNQATYIISDDGAAVTGGEIFSATSSSNPINYSTLQWFRYADGKWAALETDLSKEEDMNIGARADLAGEGLYVLMAKGSSTEEALPVKDLEYTQSKDKDAYVNLTFKDPNKGTAFYNVYYSDTKFDDITAAGVVTRTFDVNAPVSLNLVNKDREVYAAVEVVLEDGSKSPLSDIILISGEADSDGDGIPDSYNDKYSLWPKDGEKKDIANSDDDGDGLTNLEEYERGSDPKNPNDPVKTEKVPVASISLPETMTVGVGQTATLQATILPDNASTKSVIWTSEDPSIVTVEGDSASGKVTGVAEGTATIIATTRDGGYVGKCVVTVGNTIFDPMRFIKSIAPAATSLNPFSLVDPGTTSSAPAAAGSEASGASPSNEKISDSPTTGDAARPAALLAALASSIALGIFSKKRRK